LREKKSWRRKGPTLNGEWREELTEAASEPGRERGEAKGEYSSQLGDL